MFDIVEIDKWDLRIKSMLLSNNIESIAIVGSDIIILEYTAWYIALIILPDLF